MYKIYYVTSNQGKYVETQRFLARYAPEIDLQQHILELDELQLLDEQEVLKHKAHQAWQALRKPLLIDDAGIYLHAFPKFPGTLTKPTINSLGYKGIEILTACDKGVEFYVGMTFVDEQGDMHYFRGVVQGKAAFDEPLAQAPYRFDFYARFQPEGADKTLAEMWDDPASWHYFGRVRAAQAFADWLRSYLK